MNTNTHTNATGRLIPPDLPNTESVQAGAARGFIPPNNPGEGFRFDSDTLRSLLGFHSRQEFVKFAIIAKTDRRADLSRRPIVLCQLDNHQKEKLIGVTIYLTNHKT
jgi:hypothetical protein